MTTGIFHVRFVCAAMALLAAVVLIGGSARASSAAGEPPLTGLSLLPATADFAVVLGSGSSIRRSGMGELLVLLMDGDGALAEAQRAWPDTARQLGWSPDELFDRVLGGRVVLAAEGGPQARNGALPGERGWVMICDISPDTATRLRQRLTAAPRALRSGHQVLSLEAGQYELAISRASASAKGGAAAESPLLIVGPSRRSALFDSVLSILARRRNPADQKVPPTALLSETDAGAWAGRAPAADAQMLIRLHGDHPSPPAKWKDYAAISGVASPDGRQWTIQVALHDSDRRAKFSQVVDSSDAPFRRMIRSGAAAAVLQNSAATTKGDIPVEADGLVPADLPARAAGALGTLLFDLGLDAEAQSALTGRQALMIRAVDVPEDAAAKPILPAFSFAFETTDPRGLSRMLDGRVAVMANTIEKRLGGGGTPPRDFVGVRPEAVRVLPLTSPASNPLSALIGQGPGPGGPTVCWSYPFDDRAKGSGWWVVTGVPGVPGRAELPVDPAASHRAAAEAMTSSTVHVEGESARRWMSLGRLERRALEPALPLLLPDNAVVRRAVGRIEVLQWETWLTEEQRLLGEFSLVLSPPAVRPGVQTP